MKRLFALICAVAVLMSSSLVSSAQDSARFSLEVEDIKSNRLFDVSVSAVCSSAISGGEFELTYDSSVAQYRDVSSGYFEVKAKDYGDKVHIVFATANTVESGDTAEIISMRFKSIAQGEFDAQLRAYECIDDKLQSLTASSVSTTITVKKDTVTATSKSTTGIKSVNKSSKSKSQAVQSEDSETESGYSAMSVDSGLDTDKAILYGACAGLIVIVAFALGMMYRKKADSNSDNKDEKE